MPLCHCLTFRSACSSPEAWASGWGVRARGGQGLQGVLQRAAPLSRRGLGSQPSPRPLRPMSVLGLAARMAAGTSEGGLESSGLALVCGLVSISFFLEEAIHYRTRKDPTHHRDCRLQTDPLSEDGRGRKGGGARAPGLARPATPSGIPRMRPSVEIVSPGVTSSDEPDWMGGPKGSSGGLTGENRDRGDTGRWPGGGWRWRFAEIGIYKTGEAKGGHHQQELAEARASPRSPMAAHVALLTLTVDFWPQNWAGRNTLLLVEASPAPAPVGVLCFGGPRALAWAVRPSVPSEPGLDERYRLDSEGCQAERGRPAVWPPGKLEKHQILSAAGCGVRGNGNRKACFSGHTYS